MYRLNTVLLLFITLTVNAGTSSDSEWPIHEPPIIQMLQSKELVRLDAPEARQGVAVDAKHYYAIGNYEIAKYSRNKHQRVARWRGAKGGPVTHLNSCFVDKDELVCAHSNYPNVPFANSVEWYDRATLQPKRSKSLGVMDEGSLVWLDKISDGWIVGLAHYNNAKGLGFKDNRYATIERYDSQWRRTGGWAFPEALLQHISPKAASGGALGPDGYLYVMGHDYKEMYVLGKPLLGPTLVHFATIAIDAEGQAFDFDEDASRNVCAISRPNKQIRCFELPNVAANPKQYLPLR
ncbi:hypothetical protein [Aliiglaciecola aliphaticivorans]